MKQGRYTEEQIAFALKQIEKKLVTVPEMSRKMGVSQQAIHKWRHRYGGIRTRGNAR